MRSSHTLPARTAFCTLKGSDVADLNAWHIAAMTAALLLLTVLLFCWLLPYRAFRLGLWLFGHGIYRLRLHGHEYLPAAGPALIVCNRATHLDWIWLLLVTPRRIRCVVLTPFAH